MGVEEHTPFRGGMQNPLRPLYKYKLSACKVLLLVATPYGEGCQEHYHATGKRLSYPALCKELTHLKQQPEFAFPNGYDAQALQQVLKVR